MQHFSCFFVIMYKRNFFTVILIIKRIMKINFYTSILLAMLLQSCLPAVPYDENYLCAGFAIGSAEKSGNISYINTDDTLTFILKNGTFPDSIVGLRVYAEGDLYNGSGGFDYALNAYCFVVPIKEAQFANNQDAINLANNASVSLNNNRVWQTGKYLNLFLIYYAVEIEKHSFDFFIDSSTEKFENNRVTINICHNNGGDIASNYKNAIFSLDLTNLFEKFTDDFEIKFVYIENSQKKEVIISNIKR